MFSYNLFKNNFCATYVMLKNQLLWKMQQYSMVRWGARYIAEKMEDFVNLNWFFFIKKKNIRIWQKVCLILLQKVFFQKSWNWYPLGLWIRICSNFFPNHSSHSAKVKKNWEAFNLFFLLTVNIKRSELSVNEKFECRWQACKIFAFTSNIDSFNEFFCRNFSILEMFFMMVL